MCQICALGQRQLNLQRSTTLLDTSQFSTLIVKEHRRESTDPSTQPSISRVIAPQDCNTLITEESIKQELGDRNPANR